jgi:asparagine synthase (glutamine-hydrolysing)
MSLLAGILDWTADPGSASLLDAMFEPLRASCSEGIATRRRGACHFGLGRRHVGDLREPIPGPIEIGDLLVVVEGRLDGVVGDPLGSGAARATTEQLVAAGYERWGTGVFSRLRGEFAVLIWDDRKQSLVAARDPFGIRPLHYARVGDLMLLATDAEQILASGLVSVEPDDAMVMDYLLWDIHHVDRSFLRDIRALAPGHFLEAGSRGCQVSSYRVPVIADVGITRLEEAREEFQRVFMRSVEARMRSSYPVVAQLSGGLDSTSVVCTADRLLLEKPDVCPGFVAAGAIFPKLSSDEEPFIRAVQRHVRVPVECWDGTRASVNEIEEASPVRPGGRFLLMAGTEGDVEIAGRLGARIVLTGVGGDQIGVAKGGFKDAINERRWGDAGHMLLGGSDPRTARSPRHALRLLKTLAPEWLQDLRRAVRSARPAPSWMAPGFAAQMPRRGKEGAPHVLRSEIHRRRWLDLTIESSALSLLQAQHHGTRHGVEYRFPFFDLDLVALMFAIPPRLWPPEFIAERLHRHLLQEWLPPEQLRRRSKANFTSALALRVKRHLPAIRDLFWLPGWRSTRYVAQSAAQAALIELERSTKLSFYASYEVWAIAMLEAWLRKTLMYPMPRSARAS